MNKLASLEATKKFFYHSAKEPLLREQCHHHPPPSPPYICDFEVREELEEVLGKLPPPVRVVFSNQRWSFLSDLDLGLDDDLGLDEDFDNLDPKVLCMWSSG